jgi:hypothetical protein
VAKPTIDKRKIESKRKRRQILNPSRRAIAQAKTGEPTRLERETMLEALSGQFARIDLRVAQDVDNVRQTRKGSLPLGFIMYPLKGPKGDELTDVAIGGLGLTNADIEASDHYKTLSETCARLKLSLRLDHRYVSDHPELTRSLFVVIDGWT